jgi:hypothetical protein
MAGVWIAVAVIELLFLAVFTAWLLRFYAAKGTHWSALVIVFISWCGAAGRSAVFCPARILAVPLQVSGFFWNNVHAH